jgi:hypothetical protein
MASCRNIRNSAMGSSAASAILAACCWRRRSVAAANPGHGDSFDGARLREIASAYLERVVSH